jgi:hypothetical protein
MFSATHKMIADIVYAHIERELGVKLDHKAFRNGSVAPDIRFSMRVIKHTRKGSFELVKRIGNDLILLETPVTKAEMKMFSYKLGIIMHFLCDYFCTPHNDIRYKNLIKHLRYENKLKKLAYHSGSWNMSAVNQAVLECMWKRSDFERIILEKSDEYRNTDASFYKDLEFALVVSTITTLNIVRLSQARSGSQNCGMSEMELIPV